MSTPETGLVVIKSNLAIPALPEGPHTLKNPLYAPALKGRFIGAPAFEVPEEIELRLYGAQFDPCEHETAKRIRRLGHGIPVTIERDHPDTEVSLTEVARKGSGINPGQYLGWAVRGLATIPSLGFNEIPFRATHIPGRRIPPLMSRSAVMLGEPNSPLDTLPRLLLRPVAL